MRGLCLIFLAIVAIVAVPLVANATDCVITEQLVTPVVAQFVAPIQYVQETVAVPVNSYTTQRIVQRIESPTYVAADAVVAADVFHLTGTQRFRSVQRINAPVQRVQKQTIITEQINTGCATTLGFSSGGARRSVEKFTVRRSRR